MQVTTGKGFSSQQVVWLEKIKAYIITSVRIEAEDLQEMPQEAFQGYQLFGNDLGVVLRKLSLLGKVALKSLED